MSRYGDVYDSSSLDIGCGYVREHVKKGEIGVDIRRGLCDVQASAYFLPFKDNCFKRVIMSHVLEHLIKCEDALKEAGRVLNEDGRLIVEVPNPYSFNIFKDIILRKPIRSSSEHVFAFSVNELRNLLRKLGFEIMKVEYVHSSLTEEKLKETVFWKRTVFMLIWRIYPRFRTAIKVEGKLKKRTQKMDRKHKRLLTAQLTIL